MCWGVDWKFLEVVRSCDLGLEMVAVFVGCFSTGWPIID